MWRVASAMSEPAEPAFVLMKVYVGMVVRLRTPVISAAESSRPP
jgi:hypothetical protein